MFVQFKTFFAGNGLLYVEWTIDCPQKWDTAMIASDINHQLSVFQEEFCIESVYIETNSRLIIYSTSQSSVFRSFDALEEAVQRLFVNIMKVCNLKSNALDDFDASLLIMTKPEEGGKYMIILYINGLQCDLCRRIQNLS